MRVAILLAIMFAGVAVAAADAISITSPDHAQTFAYGSMISHQFFYNRRAGELAAQVTFSNSPYYGDDQPRRDEAFDFHFPGIQLDSSRRLFVIRSKHGALIPVARFHEGLACGWIDLAPGAKIYLQKESGRVTAILTATDYPRTGARWVQVDDNFSLQNLLVSLFGEFHVRTDIGGL